MKSPLGQMQEVFDRIRRLTNIDLQNKTVFEILASAGEELGEFSRELKIEEGSFGNAHKEPDSDGTKGEAVDMVIMALALFSARGGTPIELVEYMGKKIDKWESNQKPQQKSTCEHNPEVIRRFDCDGCEGMVVWCVDCGATCTHDEHTHNKPETWDWKLPTKEQQ